MLSPELQQQADEIRRNKSLVKALQAERDLWKQKAGEAYDKLDQLSSKPEMSDEDRDEIKRQSAELDALNDELEGAAQENVQPEVGQPVTGGIVEPTPPPNDPDAPRPDPIAGTGQNGTVPLMPNMSFDPSGGVNHGPGDAGQPNQAPTIETAGGFIVSGGGNTARAPGSTPDSPSSSVDVPQEAQDAAAGTGIALDPDGKPATGGTPQPVQPPASPAS